MLNADYVLYISRVELDTNASGGSFCRLRHLDPHAIWEGKSVRPILARLDNLCRNYAPAARFGEIFSKRKFPQPVAEAVARLYQRNLTVTSTFPRSESEERSRDLLR